MKLAYTIAPGRGDTDLLLAALADTLSTRGLRCCGTVQINSTDCDPARCDMDVRVLPEGPVIRISQDRGPMARGCRLDPEALERAVALTEARLAEGADLLVVNKFGRHEAEGRGFRNAIALALERGIPVLAGLNGLNREAFETFSGNTAEPVDPDAAELLAWVDAALDTTRGAA
mgnify:CR=1 FL=1